MTEGMPGKIETREDKIRNRLSSSSNLAAMVKHAFSDGKQPDPKIIELILQEAGQSETSIAEILTLLEGK